MKAAIITIGDEILIGQITDTNSGFIAQKVDGVGIEVIQSVSVRDDAEQIAEILAYFQNKVDFVFITGGLGPTKDDITKKVFVQYFDDVLIQNEEVLTHVKNLIEEYYKKPITQTNIDQALVPSRCQVLFNDCGTAPGMWMVKEKTVYVSLPGVPYEMKHLIQDRVIPKIVKEYNTPFIIHKTIMTYGVGESLLAEQIESWEQDLPSYIKLAYLPSPGRVRLRLTAKGTSREKLESELTQRISTLNEILGDTIVGYDESEPIEVLLGKVLTDSGYSVSTAESCTGGKLASRIVSVPGASAYFYGSIVSYTIENKIKNLKISRQLIEEHSVVSEKVAESMAENIRLINKTTYGIGVTGNAGPSSQTIEDDLGVVIIAVAHPKGVFSERFYFGKPREAVINRAVNKAMNMLLKFITKN
ncbi:MAG: CinA family nicotinamide mononucleotide deamidase-related protein [Flavobacteriales bacterium]|nr:CinA family nicotinamide mononucleotide deamidase-related protein [Flavobacteriales bacterium]